MRVFLSYGHDEHATLAQQIKRDLEALGHYVWFDLDRLKAGVDWEAYVEEGLNEVSAGRGDGRFLLLMTPYSVRRPDGFCLNELTRAIERKLPIVPVMVVDCEPPLSICRLQWLDMRDCVPAEERAERYTARFSALVEALKQGQVKFEGEQARLLSHLEPLEYDEDLAQHLARFTGRDWVFERVDEWLADSRASRVFWITGEAAWAKRLWRCGSARTGPKWRPFMPAVSATRCAPTLARRSSRSPINSAHSFPITKIALCGKTSPRFKRRPIHPPC